MFKAYLCHHMLHRALRDGAPVGVVLAKVLDAADAHGAVDLGALVVQQPRVDAAKGLSCAQEREQERGIPLGEPESSATFVRGVRCWSRVACAYQRRRLVGHVRERGRVKPLGQRAAQMQVAVLLPEAVLLRREHVAAAARLLRQRVRALCSCTRRLRRSGCCSALVGDGELLRD